jgi:type III secretory pathway lipoprotein EscJ
VFNRLLNRFKERLAGAKQLITLIIVICLIAGCGKQTLIENISQKRAMQIVVLLHKQGLSASASKETGGQGKYFVEVDAQSHAHALEIIQSEGLFDEPAPSFEELTTSSSFFPASREVEALRLDYALSIDIKRLLEDLPGIEHAQVLVRKRFGSKDQIPPSVSVVLKLDGIAQVNQELVSALIARSVPGVSGEQIFISMEQARSIDMPQGNEGVLNQGGKVSYVPLVPFVFKWRVPKDDYVGFASLFLVCIFAVGALSVLFGYALAKVRSGDNQKKQESSENNSSAYKIERPKRDLLE